MKKLLKLTSIILALLTVFSLVACSGAITNDDSSQPSAPQSEYEKLNNIEKEIVDGLLETSESFYNPSDVRVLAVYHAFIQDNGKVNASLKIQGTNKVGGTITKSYNLFYSESGKYYFLYETTNTTGTAKDVSVAKINSALKEYWNNNGI